jgi:tetratricopeptide (TPR) repeat protein
LRRCLAPFIEYAQKELEFNLSGDVSDESQFSIGKFVSAELQVIGQLQHLGSAYRFTASAYWVEKLLLVTAPRFTVADNRELRDMMAALGGQPVVAEAPPAPAEVAPPQSAGTFLDRGILFAMRGEYDMAIADFSEAIRLKPDMAGAYILRGRALVASVSNVTRVSDNFGAIATTRVVGQAISSDRAQLYDLAIAEYTQMIRLDPSNVKVYNERGQTYSNKADFDRAIADLEAALRTNPNSATIRQNLEAMRQQRGR